MVERLVGGLEVVRGVQQRVCLGRARRRGRELRGVQVEDDRDDRVLAGGGLEQALGDRRCAHRSSAPSPGAADAGRAVAVVFRGLGAVGVRIGRLVDLPDVRVEAVVRVAVVGMGHVGLVQRLVRGPRLQRPVGRIGGVGGTFVVALGGVLRSGLVFAHGGLLLAEALVRSIQLSPDRSCAPVRSSAVGGLTPLPERTTFHPAPRFAETNDGTVAGSSGPYAVDTVSCDGKCPPVRR